MKKYEKEVLQAFLNEEKRVLAALEDNYAIALHDINLKLENLLGRNDADLPHVIYQIDYQRALKTQVQAILEQLQVNEFETISDYLTRCYNTGFIGSMYSFHKQGLPFLMPIDQKQVVDAIQHKTKLKQKLYDELGVDIKKLQKTIAGEISRGISTGLGFGDIARNISMQGRIPLNRAMTIARTESHRIQCQATSDAQYKAKEKGADVLKQWNAALDGATRPNHRQLDGQIRELDEPFEVAGMKAMFPGDFGDPAEDCNCRCAILQRARWALDEEELEELKERAAYYGLDKAKDFEDYQKKYLKAVESENFSQYTESEKINKNIKYAVDSKMVESRAYIDKFKAMTDDADVQKEYYQAAKDILKHRSGQNGEDLYLYNTKKKKWYKSTTGKEAGTPEYTQDILDGIANAGSGELVSFHNHPASMPPSADDINSALKNGYSKGYAFCHDGKIFEYTASDRVIDTTIYDLRIAKYQKNGYNEYEAQFKTMEYLAEIYGFTFREVK